MYWGTESLGDIVILEARGRDYKEVRKVNDACRCLAQKARDDFIFQKEKNGACQTFSKAL